MELARRIRWFACSLPVVVAAVAVIGRPWPPGVLAARGRSADRPQIAPAVIVLPARGPSQPGRRALVRSAPAPE